MGVVRLYMRDGDIKETGTHDELLDKNGMYAELYNSQFVMASYLTFVGKQAHKNSCEPVYLDWSTLWKKGKRDYL